MTSSVGKRLAVSCSAIGTIASLVLAFLNPGVESTEVELNDGGVWVTNSSQRLVGHLNYPARSLDTGLRSGTASFTVFQHGEHVLFSDVESATMGNIDVASATLSSPVDYSGFVTHANAGTMLAADAAAGKVWVQSSQTLTPIDTQHAEPDIDQMPGVIATVGEDGAVHAISAQAHKMVSIIPRAGGGGKSGENVAQGPLGNLTDLADRHDIPLQGEALAQDTRLQISSVGALPVAFDRESQRLFLPDGKSMVIDAENLTLQEPGPHAPTVLLASNSALIEVPLDGGKPLTHPLEDEAASASATPTRPVRHMGCAYGAWSGTGAFMRHCDIDTDDVTMKVDTLKTAEQAVFRTNRDVIVLNDVANGNVWLPDAHMVLVDNWDQIESTIESEDESDEDSPDEADQTLLPERSETNTPPVAADDEFGVRAGQTNILPVIQNDSDADGDYLTAAPVSHPNVGEVSPARDGAALQINVPKDASGSSTFEYEVSDGRGGTAKARVTLTVRTPDVNEAPKQILVPTVALSPGRKATLNALANWYDPDGDPFYVDKAEAPAGISARAHVSGTLDVAEVGHGPGKGSIALHVSDGRAIGKGEVKFSIKDNGNEPPTANSDHVVVRVGSSASFSPLANDTDPNGDALRLVQVDTSPAGASLTMNGNLGTVTVEGSAVGTYYVGYVISDGPATAQSFIRVDVVDGAGEAPPSAEPDLGVLPQGGQVLIDLLANDSDPTGGVLTVRTITLDDASPLSVALINHHMVRVSASKAVTTPQTFTYTVTNGHGEANATVTILPKDANTGTEPPEVADDQLVVRVGDVGSVAVLANDRSPAGLKLTVSNDLQHEIPTDLGAVFVSDNVVRVRGGSRAGSGKIIYTVHDSAGNVASGVVNLVVVAMDAEANTPPRPRDITARVVAGSTTTIPIPLDSIDPEGDSVSLVGVATAPRLGTVSADGTLLRYEAAADSRGTDSFTYVVEDRLGKQATGTVRIGVAPRAEVNHNPVATADQVLIKPGTRVSVAVLANDTDPDGDKLRLMDESVSSPSNDLEITPRSGRIVVRVPDSEGTHIVSYGVSDGRGGSAQGILNVVVRHEAPELAPIARDDHVTGEDLAAATNRSVTINVLDNDEDPDGDIQEAQVTSSDTSVTVNSDKTLSIALAEAPQILLYTVEDTSGKKASAVVRVPGLAVTRPTLRVDAPPVRVRAGQGVDIPINDHIAAREGRSVLITSAAKVSAGAGHNGQNLVKDDTTLTFGAQETFSGRTSVTLEVTDGQSLSDPSGVTAVITIPIDVLPTDNRPPTFTPTGISVAAGEEAISVDLAPMVSDPDQDDPTRMTYRVVGDIPTGLSASLSGSTLSVASQADTPRGPAGSIRMSVDDGKGGTAEASIPVSVTSTTRPLIQTTPAQVTITAGNTTTVNVLDYATNPFPGANTITLEGPPSASDGGRVTANGTTLTIQADSGFNGTFTVTYTLGDASKDPARHVQGIITVTVRDKPSPPTNAHVVSNSAGTAQISWTAGAANGAPISGFTVTDHTQGDSKDCGLVTTCLMSGRTNGVEHTFSVTATNEIGTSEPSNRTSTTIDIEPEAPPAPTLRAADREITVSWQPPHNDGSNIIDYEVTLSPAGSRTVPASNRSVTFTGLTNGVEYVATVRARNTKGQSPASLASPAATPYGPPGAPQALQGMVDPSGASARVIVTWNPSNPNGRAVEYYTLSIDGTGITRQIPGTQTTATVEGVPYSASQLTVRMTATNDTSNPGSYTSPAQTITVWALGTPPTPQIRSVHATGNDREVRIDLAPLGTSGGWRASDLSLEWRVRDAGSSWQPLSGTIVQGNGLTNGEQSFIQVRASGAKGGERVVSENGDSQVVVPYGPPSPGTVDCHAGQARQVICGFSGGSGNGRPYRLERTVTRTNNDELLESGPIQDGWSGSWTTSGDVTIRTCVRLIQESGDPNVGERQVESCDQQSPNTVEGMWRVTWDGGDHAINGVRPNCRTCQWARVHLWGWDSYSSVRCWTSNFLDEASNDELTLQTDANGEYVGIPPFNHIGVWAGSGRFSPKIECEGTKG